MKISEMFAVRRNAQTTESNWDRCRGEGKKGFYAEVVLSLGDNSEDCFCWNRLITCRPHNPLCTLRRCRSMKISSDKSLNRFSPFEKGLCRQSFEKT